MIDAPTLRRPSAHPALRRAIAVLLTTLLATVIAAPAAATSVGTRAPGIDAATSATTTTTAVTPATTSTATTMAMEIYSWLNRDRKAAGLRSLRMWNIVNSVALQRAGNMAGTTTLSHSAAGGDPGVALTNAGATWWSYGEIIGTSSYPWGYQAAANLYSMWKHSAPHHAIMFSKTYNYIGIGFVQAPDGTTWASVLFSESPDHTRPIAHNGSLTRSGTSIHFTWSGTDPLLQTHTAGIRSFDVQYRVDNGAWRLVRNDTTGHSITLYHRAHGHSYSFRVQAADRRGNLSSWTSVKRIWVP
jgi:uncharacterized protein YkwD